MKKKISLNAIPDFEDIDSFGDDEELDDIGASKSSKHGSTQSQSQSMSMVKRPRQKGPIDVYFARDAEKDVQNRKKNTMLRQSTINEACKKELREKACRDIARWMYDAAIPFNAVNYPSFDVMIESIGQYGVGLKPPSFHEVRVPLLKKEMSDVTKLMKTYEEEWAKYGCSLMADGWTDKKQRTLINFLVNSPKGTFFIKSVDASGYAKTGEKMFELLDSFVERIGETNVIQVVTDNASSNVLAGKEISLYFLNFNFYLLIKIIFHILNMLFLQFIFRKTIGSKKDYLFWTPYVVHCIDLMLEDIGKVLIVIGH